MRIRFGSAGLVLQPVLLGQHPDAGSPAAAGLVDVIGVFTAAGELAGGVVAGRPDNDPLQVLAESADRTERPAMIGPLCGPVRSDCGGPAQRAVRRP